MKLGWKASSAVRPGEVRQFKNFLHQCTRLKIIYFWKYWPQYVILYSVMLLAPLLRRSSSCRVAARPSCAQRFPCKFQTRNYFHNISGHPASFKTRSPSPVRWYSNEAQAKPDNAPSSLEMGKSHDAVRFQIYCSIVAFWSFHQVKEVGLYFKNHKDASGAGIVEIMKAVKVILASAFSH